MELGYRVSSVFAVCNDDESCPSIRSSKEIQYHLHGVLLILLFSCWCYRSESSRYATRGYESGAGIRIICQVCCICQDFNVCFGPPTKCIWVLNMYK